MVKTQKLKKKEKIIPEILKEDLLNQRVKIQPLKKKRMITLERSSELVKIIRLTIIHKFKVDLFESL